MQEEKKQKQKVKQVWMKGETRSAQVLYYPVRTEEGILSFCQKQLQANASLIDLQCSPLLGSTISCFSHWSSWSSSESTEEIIKFLNHKCDWGGPDVSVCAALEAQASVWKNTESSVISIDG